MTAIVKNISNLRGLITSNCRDRLRNIKTSVLSVLNADISFAKEKCRHFKLTKVTNCYVFNA
jgi:hypothetical protein